MNKRRLNRLAKALEDWHQPFDFSMVNGLALRLDDERNVCNTACCIAGTTVMLLDRKAATDFIVDALDVAESCGLDEVEAPFFGGLRSAAIDLLDLTYKQANRLFTPDEIDPGKWDEISPAWAARCIRKLVTTGEVDWLGTQEA